MHVLCMYVFLILYIDMLFSIQLYKHIPVNMENVDAAFVHPYGHIQTCTGINIC